MSSGNETMGGLPDFTTDSACLPPFLPEAEFPVTGGYIAGRLCSDITGPSCCLPCPLTDWVYSDNFHTATQSADWVNVAGMVGCAFLLLSWLVLPVERTHRHYLSICLTIAVVFMNLGFIVPLAGKPEQCYNEITPHGQDTSAICAVSGAFLLFGGWGGVMWIFLRALSLHLQICWQLVVGRNYMWFSQAVGWGIPVVGLIILLVFSGLSFRFGQTCHINHENSLADFWIPLLIFAGLTVIIQFATFGYCIKVYLASLADNASTGHSGAASASYANSIRTMTPRQAYRRVRRVIQLQWRGIAIVLVIIADVIFFAIIFVFLDNTVEEIKHDKAKVLDWVLCIAQYNDKNMCLDLAKPLVVGLPTVTAVLVLLAMNGLWLLLLLGRWSMVTGWMELFASLGGRRNKEFVSADARMDLKNDPRTYEMLDRDSAAKNEDLLTPSSAMSPTSHGRKTPDYFGQTAPYQSYQPHQRSFSSPRTPQNVHFEMMNTHTYPRSPEPARTNAYSQAYSEDDEDMNPLGMNRVEKQEEAEYNPSDYRQGRGTGHVFL